MTHLREGLQSWSELCPIVSPADASLQHARLQAPVSRLPSNVRTHTRISAVHAHDAPLRYAALSTFRFYSYVPAVSIRRRIYDVPRV